MIWCSLVSRLKAEEEPINVSLPFLHFSLPLMPCKRCKLFGKLFLTILGFGVFFWLGLFGFFFFDWLGFFFIPVENLWRHQWYNKTHLNCMKNHRSMRKLVGFYYRKKCFHIWLKICFIFILVEKKPYCFPYFNFNASLLDLKKQIFSFFVIQILFFI